ncbi:MAG: hypothetical protein EPO32_01510 [Anaerolineae bacterium]|nr:MAG: hypothetical protein EPO32_01510 [Anaerolineae bacterium]
MFAVWLLWQVGAGYVWAIETVLVAAFRPEAAAFTSLAAFMLLFGMMRWAAGWGVKAVTALLAWGAKREMQSEIQELMQQPT